ncbi:MAG: glycosyltransferase family 4 protein [Gaiellaceae bacterium]
MRILILNWRDVRSTRGGGAERVTHEIARRLAERGHSVSWLSSSESGLAEEESIDGVRVIRRGSELTTRFHAPRLAREGYDVVVDAINTVPYLAPLWSRAPVVVFFHQLARNVWWYEAPLPVAALGWAIEPVYLQAYRRTPAVAVSPSTRDDLRRLGLRGTIDVIPLAVSSEAASDLDPKSLEGRLVAIGRLTPSKRFDHAIGALAELRRTHPSARLDIIGIGGERERLRDHAASLGVSDWVTLHGRVDDGVRDRLLEEADAVVGTSVREGWGLTVTEAAMRGTPAVVYDIPGFRDSVVADRTGVITQPSPEALANGIRRLIDDPTRYEVIRAAALKRAAQLSWDRTADGFEAALAAATGSRD